MSSKRLRRHQQNLSPSTAQDLLEFQQFNQPTNSIDTNSSTSSPSTIESSAGTDDNLSEQQGTSKDFHGSEFQTQGQSADVNTWPLNLNALFVHNYAMGDIVGTGSYAEVRECLNMITLERCAVKIVNKSFIERRAPQSLSNQMKEIHLLRRLRHENIVRLIDCFTVSNMMYIVLEYCTWLLQSVLDLQRPDHKLPEIVARAYFVQLINGVDYLHSHGVIHRDIKPANLLIDQNSILKIIDFGVSCELLSSRLSDRCTNYEGSPLFQAPEVVSGQKNYGGFKVDVWSSGVTLFLMLCGHFPFVDDALLGLYDKILGEPLRVPRDINPAAAHLLGWMLDKDCDRRSAICDIQSHPWCIYLENDNDSYFVESFLILNTKDDTGRRDQYRSMTILPYLHSHHFPRKKGDSQTSPASPKSSLKSSPKSSPKSIQPDSKLSDSQTTEIDQSDQSISSAALSNASSDSSSDYISADDEESIEWGSEQQYRQIKMPTLRANRFVERRALRPTNVARRQNWLSRVLLGNNNSRCTII